MKFEKIMMGTPTDDLKKWAHKIAEVRSQEYLSKVTYEKQVADTRQGMRQYIASFFGNKRPPSESAKK